MRQGVHYDQIYALVASWNSIRTLLILSALHKWHTRQIDYVLAFPQAPVEREIYMQIPRGFRINEDDTRDYILQIHRDIYGQKQAGRVWNKYLTDILVNKVGFRQSEVNECVFYRGTVMYVLYADDSILAGPDITEIDRAIQDIKDA
jgi:Reverse transcriptase (RNA-dependent DNA polymerase)